MGGFIGPYLRGDESTNLILKYAELVAISNYDTDWNNGFETQLRYVPERLVTLISFYLSKSWIDKNKRDFYLNFSTRLHADVSFCGDNLEKGAIYERGVRDEE